MPPQHRTQRAQRRFTPTPVGNAIQQGGARGHGPVHPHARGECGTDRRRPGDAGGSPPRPWGMPSHTRRTARRARFTPTPVGNAQTLTLAPSTPAVHPHARGECDLSTDSSPMLYGSPPRPWGMHLCHVPAGALRRFTPTPVGNALQSGASTMAPTVHPHARGECEAVCRRRRMRHGSPPRPWGMPPGTRLCRRTARFTPTPVGNAKRRCRPPGTFARHLFSP